MKLLVNLCSHDGIISHYTGVGTMVKRYVECLISILEEKEVFYTINLFTAEYNEYSFGYSKTTYEKHSKLKRVNIIEVSNSTNGKINFGTPNEWEALSYNTANIINSIDVTDYDCILTIANDPPFAHTIKYLNESQKHKKVWIPHSSILIQKRDSALSHKKDIMQKKKKWEKDIFEFISSSNNCYIGTISQYFLKLFSKKYNIKSNKFLNLINGEMLNKQKEFCYNEQNEKLYSEMKNFKEIILAYGRAEEYKNFESVLKLQKKLDTNVVVIVQSYNKDQPILKRYSKLAHKTGAKLYIDPPFTFPAYIIKNFPGNIGVIVPSKKEPMGLIVNEIRKLNQSNILIIANNIGGLSEQISDGKNGVLVKMSNLNSVAKKIKKYFNSESISTMMKNSQIVLSEEYDIRKNFENFLNIVIGENNNE